MNDVRLDEREELILKAVVHSYITSAEPVGSRNIVKRFELDVSPATVRNVMADLEENGYLQQLHTSSGRVPTDKGYRYYVDYLMRIQELAQTERTRIEREFARRLDDADEILRQASYLLALISHQTGIVEAPSESEAEIRHIEVMPLGNERLAVLLEDSFGRVRTMVASEREPLSGEDASMLTNFLNSQLQGIPVERIASTVRGKLKDYIDEQRRVAERALQVLEAVPSHRPGLLFLEGQTQLFEYPEFRNVDKARELFGLLEERDRVLELLRARVSGEGEKSSFIVIGAETLNHGMEDISVVSAPYRIRGKSIGMVGILGPRRMPYSRLTGIVEYTAGMLGRLLTRLAS